MPIPDVSGWLHDVRDVPADYRRAGPPERQADPSPATTAPQEDLGSAPTAERSTPLKKPELFTVLVTGKGVRLRARVPGWVAAALFTFAKEHDKTRSAAPPARSDTK